MDWSEQNRRRVPFGELPAIFREATGVDTAELLIAGMQAPIPPPQFTAGGAGADGAVLLEW